MPLSRRSQWRWMTSVVIDGTIFRMFLSAWGDEFIATVTGCAPVGKIFSCTDGHSYRTLFEAGLPPRILITLFRWSLLSRDSNPGWRD